MYLRLKFESWYVKWSCLNRYELKASSQQQNAERVIVNCVNLRLLRRQVVIEIKHVRVYTMYVTILVWCGVRAYVIRASLLSA